MVHSLLEKCTSNRFPVWKKWLLCTRYLKKGGNLLFYCITLIFLYKLFKRQCDVRKNLYCIMNVVKCSQCNLNVLQFNKIFLFLNHLLTWSYAFSQPNILFLYAHCWRLKDRPRPSSIFMLARLRQYELLLNTSDIWLFRFESLRYANVFKLQRRARNYFCYESCTILLNGT